MAEFSKLVITKAGQALIAKILAGEVSNVEFTKVAASKAVYTVDELELLSALSDIMQEVEISYKARINDVAVTIETAFSNHKLTVGYNMNTIGLFAADPDDGEILYAACVELSGYCYMPPFNGITVSGALVKLITTVGNADKISLEVNPAATLTVADLMRLQKQINELAEGLKNGVPAGGTTGQVLAKKTDSDFEAEWIDPPETGNGLPDDMYAVRVQTNNPNYGSVSGGGLVFDGVSVTVQAKPAEGYMLEKWEENGVQASKEKIYTFTAAKDRTLTAMFKKPVLGVDWGTATLPLPKYWNGITYGDGKFVTLSGSSNKAAHSTDGINWTESTLPESAEWRDVAYGNGMFVAVTSNLIAYSPDAINWTKATLPSFSTSGFSARMVAYGNGKFVVMEGGSRSDGSGFNKVAYSSNGISWTGVTLPSSGDWWSLTYGNGKFVAIANNSNKVIYSTNGTSWSSATLPSSARWSSATYGDGKFVAIASYNDTAGSPPSIAYSTNGINWTVTTLPENFSVHYSAYWGCIAYGGGKFIAIATHKTGGSNDKAAYSTDGINWTIITLPISASWEDIVYGDGKFVAVSGWSSDKVIYSPPV